MTTEVNGQIQLAMCVTITVAKQPSRHQNFAFKCIITHVKHRLVTETSHMDQIDKSCDQKSKLSDLPTKWE